MSAAGSLKFKLRQQPNSRERIIFFVALFAFTMGFYKACVLESGKAVTAIQEDLDKAKAEQEKLGQQPASTPAVDNNAPSARVAASKINWIGKKSNLDLSSDALLQAAQENGILLQRFALSDIKEKQAYITKPVAITLSGNLKVIGNYLENSEHLGIPLVIERFMLNPNAQFADLVTLSIDGGFYANK